jgi:hypothetical protein
VADKERVDVRTLDELSRRDLIKRAGAGVILVYGGLGQKSVAYGAPKYRHKELAGTLRILQWSHFVPAFDRWFDNVYTKAWGRANDTEVIVDHVNQADLPGRVAAEAAAGRGHDLVATLAPLPQYEDRVINHRDIVQEVTRKRGKMADVAYRSCYNPRTKKYFGFPDNYAPDPVNWRRDYWSEVGFSRGPTTWENVRRAAPRLLPFLYNVWKARRSPKVTADDPWGWGRSLEWATSCPPPRHNFHELPRIRSESPAFDLHHPEVVLRELEHDETVGRGAAGEKVYADAPQVHGREEHVREQAEGYPPHGHTGSEEDNR